MSVGATSPSQLLVALLVATAAVVEVRASPCSETCGGWFAGSTTTAVELALSLHDSSLVGLHRTAGGPGDGHRPAEYVQRPLLRTVLKVGPEASTHAVVDVASHITIFETADCLARSDPAARCTAHSGMSSGGWQLPPVAALGLESAADTTFEVSRGVTLWGRCGCAESLGLRGASGGVGASLEAASAPIFAVTGVSAAARASSTQANAIVGLAPGAVRRPFVIKAAATPSAAPRSQLIVDAAAPALATASVLTAWLIQDVFVGLRTLGAEPNVAPSPLPGMGSSIEASVDTTVPVAALPAPAVEAIAHAVATATRSEVCTETTKLAGCVLGLDIGAGARVGFVSGTSKVLDASLPSLEFSASGRTASVPPTRYMRALPCARRDRLIQLQGAAQADDHETGEQRCWALGIDSVAAGGATPILGVAVVLAAPDGVRFDPSTGASFVNPAAAPIVQPTPTAVEAGAWWTPRSQRDAPVATLSSAPTAAAGQPGDDRLTLRERAAVLRDGGSAWSAHNGVVLVFLACGGLYAIVAFIRIRDRRRDWDARSR